MKAILEFNLPEEEQQHSDAVNGTQYKMAIQELDEYLRRRLKYETLSNYDEVDAIRTELHNILDSLNLIINQ
jgi:hypothetical protein